MLKRPRVLLFTVIVILILLIPFSICANEVINEINNYVIPSAVYNSDRVSPTMEYYKGINEYISPESGTLFFTQTDLILPGRNDLDLEIKRLYMSNVALLYGMMGEDGYSTTYSSNYINDRYGLGVGWIFGFPSIEDKGGERYLHMGDGTVYRIDSTIYSSGLDNYPLIDWTFKSSTNGKVTYSDGKVHTSSYVLTRKDKLEYYFEAGGNLLLIKDRFGNRIEFESHNKRITRIRDSVGRIIEFNYTPTEVKMTWGYNQIVYSLSQIGRTGEYRLDSVTDSIGRITRYTYEYTPFSFNVWDRDSWSSGENYALNLTKVTYPTAASSNYSYIRREKGLGDGYMEYFKIRTRYDEDNAANQMLRAAFTYEGEPDGYPDYSEDTLPDEYNYYTVIMHEDGLTQRYTFNKEHLCTETKDYDPSGETDYTLIKAKEYSEDKVLTREEITRYDTAESPQIFETIYTFDSWRNLRRLSDGVGRLTYTEYERKFQQPILSLKLKSGNEYQVVELTRDTATGRCERVRKLGRENTHALKTEYGPPGSVLMRSSHEKTLWLTPIRTRRINLSVSWYAAGGAQGCFYSVSYREVGDSQWTLFADKQHSGYFTGAKTGVDHFNIDVEAGTYEVQVYFNNAGWLGESNITVYDRSSVVEEFIDTTLPIVTDYLYDSQYPGNLILERTFLEDGRCHEINYEYDRSYNAYISRKWQEVYNADGVGEVIEERYQYDFGGRLIAYRDPEGGWREFEYDRANRLIWELFPQAYDEAIGKETFLGRRFTYSDTPERTIIEEAPYVVHEVIGDLVLEEGEYPRRMIHTYNGLGKVNRVEIDVGAAPDVATALLEERTYNYRGKLAISKIYQAIGAPGFVTSYEYDKAGRLTKVTYPNSTLESLAFTEIIYEASLPSYDIYDSQGNLKKYIYDLAGRLIGIKEYPQGPLGDEYRTIYVYDCMDNRIEELRESSQEDALTLKKRYEYDAIGRLVRTISGSNNEDMAWTAYAYDNLGNKISEEKWNIPENQVMGFVYDELGRLIKYIDPSGHIWLNYYDKSDNLTLSVDPEGKGIKNLYDSMDRKIEEHAVRVEHDLENGIRIMESLELTRYGYSSYGNMVVKKYNLGANNGEGYSTIYKYNQLNHNIREETLIGEDEIGEPLVITALREFDLTGQMTRERFENTHSYPLERALVYNGRGWLMEERHFTWGDPDYEGRDYITISYDYDSIGNRIKMTDANGDVTRYEYDGLNRVTREYWAIPDRENPGVYLDILKQECAYDLQGNKTKEVDANGNMTRYVYDPLNRLIGVIGSNNHMTNYEYDKLGNLCRTVFPRNLNGPVTIRHEYDKAGNQITRIDEIGNRTEYTYYKDGYLKSISDRKGQVITYNYDLRGLLIDVVKPDEIITYAYDEAGNRIRMTDATGTTLYTYDGAGNLRSIQKGGYTTQYFYDELGNRIKMLDPYNTTTYEYDALSRLRKVTSSNPESETSYRYDLKGRRIELQYSNGIYTTYEYTPFGWLERLTNKDAESVLSQYTYSYDAKGNQVMKMNLDGSRVEYKYDVSDQLIEEAYYLPDHTLPWKVISYSYDEVGNRISRLLEEEGKEGELIRYHYDAANRLLREEIYQWAK